MPIVSTLGAASSRGFGEFNSLTSAAYVEDVFSTTLYNGSGATAIINTGVATSNTAEWTSYKLQEGTSSNESNGVACAASGNFYITGRANDGAQYLILAKYNSSGVLQWQRKIVRNTAGASNGYAITVDSSENVYVTGILYDGTDNFAFIAKLDSSGVIQWQRSLKQASSAGIGISVSSTGNVYITGRAFNGTVNYAIIAKYNSSGTIQWQRKFQEGTAASTGQDITVDSSENVYVTGFANDGSNYAFLAKYNSSGTLQWQRKYRFSATTGYSVKTDSSGNIYVLAYTTTGAKSYLAKYNSSGVIQWQRALSPSNVGALVGLSIDIDSSDNIYVGGAISTINFGFIAKYDSSSAFQWSRILYQGSSTNVNSVCVNSSGILYANGYARDGSDNDYLLTVKLKIDGSTISGMAFVTMSEGGVSDSAGNATDAAGTATDSAGAATDALGGATDSAGTATATSATQVNVSASSGMVWLKARNTTTNHFLFDTTRGPLFELNSNTTDANTSLSNSLLSFNANGFTIGNAAGINVSTDIYTSWTFRQKQKFFDIVTYTGNGSNRTISHNLGSVPGMIIIKRTDTTAAWAVYHRSLANTEYMVLNTTAGKATDATYWNSTTPTASVFSLGTSSNVNGNNATYIAYLFAHDAGGFGSDGSQSVSVCGTFTTDGSGLATINLGWEPQFILIKSAVLSSENWHVFDNVRGVVVGSSSDHVLYPNATTAETPNTYLNLSSTGFNITGVFAINTEYIYYAIRRGPMRTPTDATKVFMPTVYTGTNVDNRLVNTTIAPDMVWVRQRNDTVLGGMVVGDRMRGQPYLLTGTTAAEVNDADSFDAQLATTEYGTAFSSMNGFWCGNDPTSKLNASTVASNQIAEAFKRAPGFFDVVAYTGTGSNRTISHNLTVAPELMMIKQRGSTTAWAVYANALVNTEYLVLNTNAARATNATYWNSTTPTSSVFSLGTSTSVNASGGNYISYLFASAPGVSKVGTYTGTGTTNQINCGFTSGARFVLIKRLDTAGDWYVYDSARGIVAGNDPYLLLNSTAAEVTNTDYVDTYSAGFELSSTAPAALNEASATTWTSRTSGFGTTSIRGIGYGNNLFVAVGDNGTLTTSPDGITWTSRTSNFGTTRIRGVSYGNGLYVAVGDSGKISTSTDGTTWTAQTSGVSINFYGVAYGNGLFVAVGDSGNLLTSPDGITWTSRTSGFGSDIITSIVYGNGIFVIGGDNSKVSTSSDGISWTAQTTGVSIITYGLSYGNGLYVAGGTALITSPDGVTWTSRTSGFGAQTITALTYGNGTFVAVGSNGTLTTSPDGINWTTKTSGFGTTGINAVTYGNSLYVIAGNSGTLSTSSVPNYIYLAIA